MECSLKQSTQMPVLSAILSANENAHTSSMLKGVQLMRSLHFSHENM